MNPHHKSNLLDNKNSSEINSVATEMTASVDGSIRTARKASLLSNKKTLLIVIVVSVIVICGSTLFALNKRSAHIDVKKDVSTSGDNNQHTDTEAVPIDEQLQPSNISESTPTTTPAAPKAAPSVAPSKPATYPTPAQPAPTPVNTTNCLPSNPNKYHLTYTNMTNSGYLQTNSYVSTKKFYAGLEFAGLTDTINGKQYVVLAMSDSHWDSLTPEQLEFMNASPANMRSVLGWQVITSCFTWDGVNPHKDMPAGTTKSVNTLNGAVTFTARANGGLGNFGSGRVSIWDWFTSNGAVTICGFVKLP